MRIDRLTVAVAAGVIWLLPAAGEEAAAQRGADMPGTILDLQRTLWRFRTIRETAEIVTLAERVEHGRVAAPNGYAWFQKNMDKPQVPDEMVRFEELPLIRLPADTPVDWSKPAFDATSWARQRGPMLDQTRDEEWKTILARGAFDVPDPGKAGDLKLSLSVRGGAVVYLNGEQIARLAMPAGSIDVYTRADPYPLDAYFSPEGYVLAGHDRSPVAAAMREKRVRTLTDVTVPAARLRKGVNVLAVSVHRAPTACQEYLRRAKGQTYGTDVWAKLALLDLQLTASPEAIAAGAIAPNVALLQGRGFKVWNQSIVQKVFVADYPDPFSPLAPIRLTGVRNGTFAAQLIVGDDRPIRGLEAAVSDLRGPGTIPASAAKVRYAVLDGARGAYDPESYPRYFDSLEDEPPAEVPVYQEHGGAVQPVWLTVSVPADARAGDYAGTVTVGADGVRPVSVPLTLHVADWTLPPVDRFATTLDIIQSPESVAMAYDVPLWSEAHFKLLDRTFSLLGPLGVKTLYITAVRRTHFGNEHAMIRWVRDDQGEMTPDLSVLEKYLDVAMKHIGSPRGVILYCWEPNESQGHASHLNEDGIQADINVSDRPALITTVDPRTGQMSGRKGPAWGTPEAKAFWKKMTDGIALMLKKRGLENAMLFGLVGDRRPTKRAMDDICSGVAEPRWAVHSHLYCEKWQGYRMGFTIALWGIGSSPADPTRGYSFGWSNPQWLSYYPREMKLTSTLVEHRTKLENWMGAPRTYSPPPFEVGRGPRGLGRIGGDFWPVIRDSRGNLRASLVGRYPESAWGQLNLEFCIPYVLGKGKAGAVPTLRSEAFREGLQEVETRVFLEKALLDDEAKTLLGEELTARMRKVLDERIRMVLHAGQATGSDVPNSHGEGDPFYISSGWSERTEVLFNLAAEVAGKLGREPKPNLTAEPPKDK